MGNVGRGRIPNLCVFGVQIHDVRPAASASTTCGTVSISANRPRRPSASAAASTCQRSNRTLSGSTGLTELALHRPLAQLY